MAEEEVAMPLPGDAQADAEQVATLFARLGAGAPNREIREAIANASDRLHPFRILEHRILQRVEGEHEDLDTRGSGQVQAIRRYHLRRMRAVAALLRERGEA